MKLFTFRFTALLSFILLIISACGDDDDGGTSIVSFTESSATIDEDQGLVTLQIEFSAPAESASEILYSLSGTAGLNGDYSVSDESPLAVAAGDQSATISFEIIDDDIIESFDLVDDNGNLSIVESDGRTMIIELTSATESLVLSSEASENTFTYTITDNDLGPNSGMQWDLTWSVDGVNDVDQVNLDMFAIYNVEFDSDGFIADAETYGIADSESGYESLIVDDAAPDSDYYLVIEYTNGSGDANLVFTTFGMEQNIIVSEQFTEQNANDNVALVAEITTKNGSTFGRQEAVTFGAIQLVKVKEGILK